jgi:hypothetical protein
MNQRSPKTFKCLKDAERCDRSVLVCSATSFDETSPVSMVRPLEPESIMNPLTQQNEKTLASFLHNGAGKPSFSQPHSLLRKAFHGNFPQVCIEIRPYLKRLRGIAWVLDLQSEFFPFIQALKLKVSEVIGSDGLLLSPTR